MGHSLLRAIRNDLTLKLYCVFWGLVVFGMVFAIVIGLTSCSGRQSQVAEIGDTDWSEPRNQTITPPASERVYTRGRTCFLAGESWRLVRADPNLVLAREGIGRITITNVRDSAATIIDVWRATRTGNSRRPDCSLGCMVSYNRTADDGNVARAHLIQAGPRHTLEIEYPAGSRNANFALSEATRIARSIGCPQSDR